MKYKGQTVQGRNQEIIPIPRQGGDIVFVATAIKDWTAFEALVSEPQPPEIIKAGGTRIKDTKDPKFLKDVQAYAELKSHFLIVHSLLNSPDLEWEQVEFDKPETWAKWKLELDEAGFTEIEITRIMTGVMRANSLDERMIDEARTNFLHGLGQEEK
jgi:hypothetical protein